MLLALDTDVIFFLLVAVIGLVNQFIQKTKKIRAESLRQKKRRETRDRVDSAQELEATREDRPLSMLKVTTDLRERAEEATAALDSAAELVAPQMPSLSSSERIKIAEQARRRLPIPAPRRATKRTSAYDRKRDNRKQGNGKSAAAVANRLRNNPAALREAIILREILGPPAAHRGPHSPRNR